MRHITHRSRDNKLVKNQTTIRVSLKGQDVAADPAEESKVDLLSEHMPEINIFFTPQ